MLCACVLVQAYCELAGWGVAFDVKPDEELGVCAMPTSGAVAQAIRKALEHAKVQ
jgi:hypothetical protein